MRNPEAPDAWLKIARLHTTPLGWKRRCEGEACPGAAISTARKGCRTQLDAFPAGVSNVKA